MTLWGSRLIVMVANTLGGGGGEKCILLTITLS